MNLIKRGGLVYVGHMVDGRWHTEAIPGPFVMVDEAGFPAAYQGSHRHPMGTDYAEVAGTEPSPTASPPVPASAATKALMVTEVAKKGLLVVASAALVVTLLVGGDALVDAIRGK